METGTRDRKATADLRCALCGRPIGCEVVRAEAGLLYHLRCYRLILHGRSRGLRGCPACDTTGRSPDGVSGEECGLCGGSGYLAGRAAAPAAWETGP